MVLLASVLAPASCMFGVLQEGTSANGASVAHCNGCMCGNEAAIGPPDDCDSQWACALHCTALHGRDVWEYLLPASESIWAHKHIEDFGYTGRAVVHRA